MRRQAKRRILLSRTYRISSRHCIHASRDGFPYTVVGNDGAGASLGTSDANSVVGHHPQMTWRKLRREDWQQPTHERDDIRNGLRGRPENDNPGVVGGRIGTNISKVAIKGKQHTSLFLANCREPNVASASQRFV